MMADTYTPPPPGVSPQPDVESGTAAAAEGVIGNAAAGASSTNISSSEVGAAASAPDQQTSTTTSNSAGVDLLSDGGYTPERQRSGNSGIHGLD